LENYQAYLLPELKKQLKKLKHRIVINRKEVYRKIKEIEELQESIWLNNRDKKCLMKEIKKRKRDERCL
jgi:hypothetical protein